MSNKKGGATWPTERKVLLIETLLERVRNGADADTGFKKADWFIINKTAKSSSLTMEEVMLIIS